jgi:hypothetical protein
VPSGKIRKKTRPSGLRKLPCLGNLRGENRFYEHQMSLVEEIVSKIIKFEDLK